MKYLPFAFLALLLQGCTAVDVKPVDLKHQVEHICIEENPKVIVKGFLNTVETLLHDRAISTERYSGNVPDHCKHHMTYTALQTWDMSMYMHYAELRLFEGRDRIGYGEYRLRGGGGLALNKWASVKSKMEPVVVKMIGR